MINWLITFEALVMVGIAMVVIKYACDSFEDASEFLGTKVYKMRSGVRGATIDAIGSSLPELFTTLFLLFLYNDEGGFAAGVATCAGSAVFNAVIIPALCILAVTIKGVNGSIVTKIGLDQGTIIRDGFFFIGSELALIYFLGFGSLAWWMGLGLMAIYAVYFSVLMKGMGQEEDSEEDDSEEEDSEAEGQPSFIKSLFTLDFNQLLFKGADFTASSAWVVLSLTVTVIAASCYLLSESVMLAAEGLQVPAYFTAVIFGAAATSVPDTILSFKNAMKGDYDDAVSNAVGSNIFDICIALGLPLFIYGLTAGHDISMSQDDQVQSLRIALVVLSVLILGIFLSGQRHQDGERTLVNIGKGHGWTLLSLYGVWIGFIVYQMSSL